MIWRCRFDSSTTSSSRIPISADTGRGQVQQRGCAETPCADHQHPRAFLQPLLPVDTQVGDDEMTAVAGDLVTGQLGSRLN